MRKIIVGVLFSGFLFTQAYATCTEEQAKKADQQWADAIGTHSASMVNQLYAKDAVLLATYKNAPITTEEGRLQYFEYFLYSMQDLKAHYNQEIVQTFPGGAVTSGIYTFSGMKHGKPASVGARFTFVYKDTRAGCQLITHHSSVLPK